MQRYDFAHHESGSLSLVYFEGVEASEGEYVLHSEARAEIERMEKEVERLTTEREWAYYAAENSLAQRNTAWNDAIEAAAVTHEESGCCHASMYAAAIRALKRPTPATETAMIKLKMTLREALEKLKDMEAPMTDRNQYIQDGWSEASATAIATILNAVVKVELK